MMDRTEMVKMNYMRAVSDEWMADTRVVSVLFSVFANDLFVTDED